MVVRTRINTCHQLARPMVVTVLVVVVVVVVVVYLAPLMSVYEVDKTAI